MKRVLLVSDFHCGHIFGLTPPGWHYVMDGNPLRRKIGKLQRIYWDWYSASIRRLRPFDVVLFNGDAIEGKGSKSGSSENITSDREEQADMAIKCLQPALNKNTKTVLTFGTAYHTGDGEDFENLVRDGVDAVKIGGHEWVEVEGVVFDLKHHVGSSAVPLELVQKVTGHRTTDIVLKHYFQPGREEFRRALQSAMPKLLTNGQKTPKDQMLEILGQISAKTLQKDTKRLRELVASL